MGDVEVVRAAECYVAAAADAAGTSNCLACTTRAPTQHSNAEPSLCPTTRATLLLGASGATCLFHFAIAIYLETLFQHFNDLGVQEMNKL